MDKTQVTSIKTAGVAGLASSVRATRTFLGRQLWVWPIIAALILGVVGWWVHVAVGDAMRRQLQGNLTTILNADVEALRAWMKEQEFNAQSVAYDVAHNEAAVEAVRELVDLANQRDGAEAARRSEALKTLRSFIEPRRQIFGYTGFFVVSPTGQVVAADVDAPVGQALDDYRKSFFQKVLGGQPSVSRPYRSPLQLPDVSDKLKLKVNLPTMFTAAPVKDGKKVLALGLRIRPEKQFTEILQTARYGKSGETYAFDKQGLLLSSSRFEDDLERLGLLMPGTRSVLTVEVRDPQVNMVENERPSLRHKDQPLTRMAADAVAGNDGTDVDGYRDYRGVPSIGAWKWLKEYDFGVATEIDRAEAFAPLAPLRLAFWGLIGLLGLSAVAIFACMVIVRRQQRAVQKAVLAARQLGQYTLEEKIGAGAMGSVYRARHALLRRPMAVKLLDPDKVSGVAVARFEREVQLTSQLNHPNTVAIYDYGRTPEGLFYYAMEYLEGFNLEDLVARHGPVPEGRVIAILQQVCGSLAEAHGLGLIHRDIKPANIFLGCRAGLTDFVKVLDFGLAKAVGAEAEVKLTAANSLTGTPLYLSPEGIERPDQVDARSDLYALGAVGYFLVTGTPVFQGATVLEVCRQQADAVPEPPSQRLGRPVNPQLEAVLLQCLAKSPLGRPASAQAVSDELGRCQPDPKWTRADAEAWWAKVRAPKPAAPHAVKKDPYGTLDARPGWSTAGASTADPYATLDTKRTKGPD
jgi:hypothetical protein